MIKYYTVFQIFWLQQLMSGEGGTSDGRESGGEGRGNGEEHIPPPISATTEEENVIIDWVVPPLTTCCRLSSFG